MLVGSPANAYGKLLAIVENAFEVIINALYQSTAKVAKTQSLNMYASSEIHGNLFLLRQILHYQNHNY